MKYTYLFIFINHCQFFFKETFHFIQINNLKKYIIGMGFKKLSCGFYLKVFCSYWMKDNDELYTVNNKSETKGLLHF